MVYDPKKAREISIKGKQVTDAVKSGMQIQVAKTNKQNQSDRVTPAQLKLIQDSRGVQSPYQPKEAIDPLDPAKGVVDKAMLNPNTILLPFDVKDDSKYSVPGGGSQGPQPTDDESEDLLRRLWSHNPMEVDSLADKWGATILPDGETWMIPTKEGTLRPATEEETLMLNEDFQHRQMYDRNQPHPDQNIAQVDYGKPTDLDKYFQKVGYPNRNQTDDERLKIMRGAPKTT